MERWYEERQGCGDAENAGEQDSIPKIADGGHDGYPRGLKPTFPKTAGKPRIP